MRTNSQSSEIAARDRFEFGRNWTHFVEQVDERRIAAAEESLKNMLGLDDLEGRSFIDIGSGSGLFSLAARRLGASVTSIDLDRQSVECTMALREEYCGDDSAWRISRGSILDDDLIAELGQFDIVYSWGVLHHTGNLSKAMSQSAGLVSDGGRLFVAIYNDQGRASRYWLRIKQAYNYLPRAFRWLIVFPCLLRLWGPTTVRDLARGKPFHTWREYQLRNARGMDPWRDVVDWVGGLPFEVAKPEEIFQFFKDRGFLLERLKTCAGGHGCNEFVFTRDKSKP